MPGSDAGFTDRRPARRRYTTVLFCDVVGSSEHAQLLEPEDYAAVLERFRSFVRTVVDRHGGVVARMQGDGALALFGHLEEREDDGRRATEAALELHAVTAALRLGDGEAAPRMQLHTGIHAGLVLVLEGDIERGRVDVVGEVPNTAARIVGLAAPGEILVSAETLGPNAHFYAMTPLRQLPIRGRAQPLDVLRIEGRRAVARRIDAAAGRGVSTFVGRQAELQALARAAARAESAATAVLLVGEPGIGKTRLIGEFEARFRTTGRVLHGFCESYLAAEPLQPLLQWGRASLGWRGDATPQANDAAIVASLDAFAGSLDDPARQTIRNVLTGHSAPNPQAVAALVSLLQTLARQSPLLLVLDDWQWVDDATRLGVASLLALATPLLLVAASRPLETAAEHELPQAEVLRLQALVEADADEAIGHWLPGADPFTVQEIVRQSGGTPLLIEELCLAVGRDQPTFIASGHVGLAWLDGMVASRLARLEPPLAACLEVASVLGHVFAPSQLQPLLDDPQPWLEALQRLDFLVPSEQPGMLRFRHVLTRDAVYATVDAARRRELHRQVAEALEQAGAEGTTDATHATPEALAYHFEASGQAAKTVRYSELAGDKALAAMALDRARGHFLAALRALDALGTTHREARDRWCLNVQKLGQTCVFDPLDVPQGLRFFQRAAALAREGGDRDTIARAEYWLGYVNYGRGQPRAAVRHCEAALAHALAADDTRLATQVQATLGQSLAAAGDYARAVPLMQQAVRSKQQHGRTGRGQAIGSAYTLGRLGYTLGDLGRFDEAQAHFDEALGLLGEPVHSVGASVRELRCVVLLWQGRWQEAEAMGLAGADIALRCRSRYLTAMGRALAACGRWMLQPDAASLAALREPALWIEGRGGGASTSLNHGWLVHACAALDRPAELRQHLGHLLRRARAGDRHGLGIGCRALAHWLAQHGAAPAQVERQFALAERCATVRNSPREAAMNDLGRAQVAALAGQAGRAREFAERAGAAFDSMHMRWHAERASELLYR